MIEPTWGGDKEKTPPFSGRIQKNTPPFLVSHVRRVDNQTADGLANGAMDKKLHIEEPLLQVVPTAVRFIQTCHFPT